MRRDAPVGHPDFGMAFPCFCLTESESERGFARLRRYSNLGVLSEARFEDMDERGPDAWSEAQARYHFAIEAARAFAANPTASLLLTGGHGTGKTRLAAAAANQIMERGVPVLFAFVPDLLDQLRGAYSSEAALPHDELFEQVKSVDVLILDDLGAHSGTPWAEEKLFQIVNHRYINGLPTLVTSSVPLERLDGRLQSKLADPRGRAIDLGGAALRLATPLGSVPSNLLETMSFDSFDKEGVDFHRRGIALTQAQRDSLLNAHLASYYFADVDIVDSKPWLVLIGEYGRGKTHLAIAVANLRTSRGEDVFYARASDLLDHLRSTYSPDSRVTYDEVFDRIRHAPLLILDDLGAENPTPWANEKLYQIIVHRHDLRLPTVITMLPPPESPEDSTALYSRIKSRLMDTRMVEQVIITSPDFRSPHWQSHEGRRRNGSH